MSGCEIYTAGDRVMILVAISSYFALGWNHSGTAVYWRNHGAEYFTAAEDMMATLKQYGVTIMIGVPRLYQLIYKGLRKRSTGA